MTAPDPRVDEIEARICSCGCGKTRSEVVRELMRGMKLNEEQAEDLLNRADVTRRAAVAAANGDHCEP